MLWAYEKPSFNVEQKGGSLYTATLSGRLAGEWAANLCAALALRRISVRGGHAVRGAEGLWKARFDVEVEAGTDPGRLDWVRLCETPARYKNAAIRLGGYEFIESAEHGGSIRLDMMEVPDSVGLLAVVFDWLYSLGLVPVEFRLDTRENGVFDQFWLKALEETCPDDHVCLALGRRLSEFVAVR